MDRLARVWETSALVAAFLLKTLLVQADPRPNKEAPPDWRNIRNGSIIPAGNCADQPYMVKTDDGAWLWLPKGGREEEEVPEQQTLTTRSTNLGTSRFVPGDVRVFLQYSEKATEPTRSPPLRAITHGPKFHWFGYYDKLQFDPSGRYVLGMEVDFEHRSPTPADTVTIGMVDLRENDRWIELGKSSAWCWQQGCMLQWRPGSNSEILWNDREGERYVCRILDVSTRQQRTIPYPIYTVSPDGVTALTADFRRIQDMRPGYGYPGLPDPFADEPAPEESGIWRVDLQTGEAQLIIPLAQVSRIPYDARLAESATGAVHWFNHLLFSPDGSRFVFLHRWRKPGDRSFTTRMLTAAPDGSDIRVVDPSGATSHFIWRDPLHILAWTWQTSRGDAFYLFEDRAGGAVQPVGPGVMTRNGHCSYLPGNEWILNDTYPDDRRLQHVYLYHVPSGERVPLGHFYSPPEYKGEWRCDTHPRFSPDGTKVVIDSPHGGNGRQMYLIDISNIVGKAGHEPRGE